MKTRLAAVLLLLGARLGATPVELSTEWILSTIQSAHLKTLDELLARFSPVSLRRHLLVYGSESQQAASFAYPRVLVHNDDASFIMAFNGEPGSAGNYDLEILRFERETNHFRPEVIHFDPKGERAPVAERQPTVCAHCHQADVRPNWDPYFHWVGFYGSEDDNYLAQGSSPINYGPEAEAFRRFQQARGTLARYRYLAANPAPRPNLCFNNHIVLLNVRRVLRRLSELPNAARVLPAFDRRYPELALQRDKLPADLVAQAGRGFEEVKRETEQAIREALQMRVNRHVDLTGWAPVGRVADMIELMQAGTAPDVNTSFSVDLAFNASFRYLFEEILHEPYYPLTTSRHPDYQLNLGAPNLLRDLSEGASVDANGHPVFNYDAPVNNDSLAEGCGVAD